MPDASTPLDVPAILKSLTDIKLSITGNLPGEQALVAVLNFASSNRLTMNPAIRDRFDAITVQQAEDLQKLWRGIWVLSGLLK